LRKNSAEFVWRTPSTLQSFAIDIGMSKAEMLLLAGVLLVGVKVSKDNIKELQLPLLDD